MVIDVDVNYIATAAVSVAAVIGGLYTRAIQAENRELRFEMSQLRMQYSTDMSRIDLTHDELWKELKLQRESLAQNREAIIKLNSSIDRLNEILPKLELAVDGHVSHAQCEFFREQCSDRRKHPAVSIPGGRRSGDTK